MFIIFFVLVVEANSLYVSALDINELLDIQFRDDSGKKS